MKPALIPATFAVGFVLVLCSACGSTGGSQSQPAGAPAVAVADQPGDLIDLQWNQGDDASTVVADWEAAGLTVNLEDTAGSSVSNFDVDGCFIDSVAETTVAPGDSVSVVVDCEQKHWDAREGDRWDEFASSYVSGYDAGCEAIFDASPDGSLYVDGYEYSILDCESVSDSDAENASDVPERVPDDPATDGESVGEVDGCTNMFDQVGGPLFYGSQSIDESVCGSGGTVETGSADQGIAVDTASWTDFESPTGNLYCHYDATSDVLSCSASNLHESVTLDAAGQAYQADLLLAVPGQANVLQYGSVWTRSVFTCESSTDGFQCAANVGSYGGTFVISKSGIVASSD